MKKFIFISFIFLFSLISCKGTKQTYLVEGGPRMKITSPAFQEGAMIPVQHTCDDKDISPALKWFDIPEGTKSFALICDDPDAPMGTWVHWVLFNIPSDTTELAENIPASDSLQNGALHGTNDFDNYGYGGPCPPFGTHRYNFKIYALDIMLQQDPGIEKKELLEAMKNHVLAEGHLMGKYKRQ